MHASLRAVTLTLVLLVLPAAARADITNATLIPAGDPRAKAAAEAAAKAWAQVPGIVARIVPPVFPGADFVITKYGAVGDGTTDCTQAFRDAIEACHRAGGGRVVVPAGAFLTGAIHLRSKVNLHVAKDAIIRFSTDPRQYLPPVFVRYECTELMNYSPFIYALDQQNIAITGEGTLDGQASKGPWYQWKSGADVRRLLDMGARGVPARERVFGEGHYLRPNFIQPVRCRNLLIEGVRIIDSPMWVVTPLYCTNVTIRRITVDTKGPNTDGCDPDSCNGVWIRDCSFSDGDDCIAIKSGRDEDGRRVNIPCQNVVIQNCAFREGHGGVTMGSETAGGIRNVFAENCQFDSPDLNMAMRFKTNPDRGGFIENVFLRNCRVKTSGVGIHLTMRYGAGGTRGGNTIPVVRNIDIRDSTFDTLSRQAIFIEGWSPAGQITDVTIANCSFGSAQRRSVITNASRIYLINTRGTGFEP